MQNNKLHNTILALIIITPICITAYKNQQLLSPLIFSLALITILLLLTSCLSKKLARTIIVSYGFILAAQIITICLTGNYIDAVALSNLDEYTAIPQSTVLQIITVIALYILLSFSIKLPTRKLSKKLYASLGALFMLILAAAPLTELPIYSFIRLTSTTIMKYHQHKKTDTRIREQQKKLYGKDYIVMSPESELITDVPNLKNKNVIVFFTEALSAKKIDLFNNYPNLTPNLSAFVKKSVYFDNYYNHTFTTYRGLRGQLSSSYQYTGVSKSESSKKEFVSETFTTDLITIPQVLNQNGYHTYFLSARASKPSNLNTMLKTLKFEKVYAPEDFGIAADLSDRQLLNQLADLVLHNKLKEPYFIAIYNIGTHFGEDSPDIKYHNGNNNLLNNIHNFDNIFGKWLNSITAQKDIINHTAIILTADHAAFADKQYCKTFGYEPEYWVDKIPLAVYAAEAQPQIIDAKGRNSLDLTPTILHMLRINKAPNYFLGCSLFKPTCIRPFDHYTIGGEIFYKTQGSHVISKPSLESWDLNILHKIEDFYHLSESTSPSDN